MRQGLQQAGEPSPVPTARVLLSLCLIIGNIDSISWIRHFLHCGVTIFPLELINILRQVL